MANTALSIEEVFGDRLLAWGKKYPTAPLAEVWRSDREYLFWAANVGTNKAPCTSPPPPVQCNLIRIAHLLLTGKQDEAERLFADFRRWEALSQEGEGLSALQRPTPTQSRKLISSSTIVAAHCDLDGLYSAAIAIYSGGALSTVTKKSVPFSRLRVLRYSFQNLGDYTTHLHAGADDNLLVIDFSAHPKAALNIDHHTTSLSYWEFGSDLPYGIFEPTMPSCPRLLGTLCGLEVPEDVMAGTDLVDGALYPAIEQAHDLTIPFVALELALSLDVSETVAKKALVTLVENRLDPYSLLETPSFAARVKLIEAELEEQREFWRRGKHLNFEHPLVTVADARLAPHSASRFRYVPFETEQAADRPYIITIRPAPRITRANLGIARNPFYARPAEFEAHDLNFGSIARSIGQGGGRREAASATVPIEQLNAAIAAVTGEIEKAAQRAPVDSN